MQTLFVVFLAVTGVLVVGALLGVLGWAYYDLRNKLTELTAELKSLGAISQTPEYLAGVERVCGDFVIRIAELNTLVEKFHGSLFGKDSASEREGRTAWKPYSETEADDAWEAQQLLEMGFGPEEAKARVEATRRDRFTIR